MCPKCFLKIDGKPNKHQFDLLNFLKFCENISHKLLRPSQLQEKKIENSGVEILPIYRNKSSFSALEQKHTL